MTGGPIRAALALAPVYLATCVFSEGGLVTDSLWGDVGHYETFARRILDGETPYGDFTVEYPPLALPVFVVPALFTSTAPDYLFAFKLQMAGLGLLVLLATAYSLSRLGVTSKGALLRLAPIALAPLLLGHVFLNRYDLWAAALVSLTIAGYLSRREQAAAGFLAASFVAKIFTVSLMPVLATRTLVRAGARGLARGVVVFSGVTVALLGYFLVTSFGGLGFSYWLQASRDLHGESLAGSVLLALDSVGVYSATIVAGDPGSLDLEGSLPTVLATATSVVAVLAIGAIWLRCRHSLRSDAVLVTSLVASVCAFLVFAKVLSPQFIVWLLPFVALVPVRIRSRSAVLLVASMLLTQAELRGWEGLAVDAWAVWLLLARNALLVGLLWVVYRELAELVADDRASSPSSASRRARSNATSCASRTLSSVSRESTVE